MPDLENLIAQWRQSLRAKIPAESLEELELHLREFIQDRLREGLSESEAFGRAVDRIGSARKLCAEFEKMERPLWWPVKTAAAVGGLAAMALPVLLTMRMAGRADGWLLGIHVFNITLGYLSVFLIGAISICHVCRRAWSEPGPGETRSLAQALFAFALAGTVFTGIGIILAMIWAKRAWGFAWSWDGKEMGGLSVLVWLVMFLLAQRFRTASSHAVLLLGLIGNVVVSLAWFAPNLAQLHNQGFPNSLILGLTIIPSLLFFFLGLAPAGLLNFRNKEIEN